MALTAGMVQEKLDSLWPLKDALRQLGWETFVGMRCLRVEPELQGPRSKGRNPWVDARLLETSSWLYLWVDLN